MSPDFRSSRGNMRSQFCCKILLSDCYWAHAGHILVTTCYFVWSLHSRHNWRSRARRWYCVQDWRAVNFVGSVWCMATWWWDENSPVRVPLRPECNNFVSPLNLITSGESMYALTFPPSGAFGFEKVTTRYLQHTKRCGFSNHNNGTQVTQEKIIRTLRSFGLCFSVA